MAMNVFTTDHPLNQPTPISKWARRWLPLCIIAYPAYLILLGPYYGLVARGYLDFIPESARVAVLYPACPFGLIPEPVNPLIAYFDFWYTDPNEPNTTL